MDTYLPLCELGLISHSTYVHVVDLVIHFYTFKAKYYIS